MDYTLSVSDQELAAMLGAELIGSAGHLLSQLDTLEDAGERSLTFIRDASYAGQWTRTRAGAVLVSRPVYEAAVENFPERAGVALLIVDDADLALVSILEAVAPKIHRPAEGVHAMAVVDETARLGTGVLIGPHVSVGFGSVIGDGVCLHAGVSIGANVVIGAESELRSGCRVEDRSQIGERCTLHANVVVGSDGFGYRPEPGNGIPIKIPHAGIVQIGDDVEIGAGTTIDRGKFAATRIGTGTKIDNHVHIGHNCIIGRGCIVCGQVGLAGSVTLGDGVTLAGSVGVADGRHIGDGATVGAGAGVMHDVPAGETWLGGPARPALAAMRSYAAIEALPEFMRQVKRFLRDSQG